MHPSDIIISAATIPTATDGDSNRDRDGHTIALTICARYHAEMGSLIIVIVYSFLYSAHNFLTHNYPKLYDIATTERTGFCEIICLVVIA